MLSITFYFYDLVEWKYVRAGQLKSTIFPEPKKGKIKIRGKICEKCVSAGYTLSAYYPFSGIMSTFNGISLSLCVMSLLESYSADCPSFI